MIRQLIHCLNQGCFVLTDTDIAKVGNDKVLICIFQFSPCCGLAAICCFMRPIGNGDNAIRRKLRPMVKKVFPHLIGQCHDRFSALEEASVYSLHHA